MFPTEFANCAAKVQQNSLNLWPLWRRIPAWAVLTANFTNHTDFFAHTTFKSDSNWVTFAPKPSGKQGLLLRGSEGLALSRASALKYCTCTYTNMQSPSRKRCILDLFSLGVSLAAVNVTAHPARVHMCKRTSFLLHLTPIYIHPHFHTHATHYFQCAISPSNYRKIHCPLMSVACRGLPEPADWRGKIQLLSSPGMCLDHWVFTQGCKSLFKSGSFTPNRSSTTSTEGCAQR